MSGTNLMLEQQEDTGSAIMKRIFKNKSNKKCLCQRDQETLFAFQKNSSPTQNVIMRGVMGGFIRIRIKHVEFQVKTP